MSTTERTSQGRVPELEAASGTKTCFVRNYLMKHGYLVTFGKYGGPGWETVSPLPALMSNLHLSNYSVYTSAIPSETVKSNRGLLAWEVLSAV
jgi:hypothetical protein